MLLKTLKTASPSRKTTGGFTLVEMLVVIVVIGLLAAIAVPIFLSQSDKASDAALKSDLSNAARMLSVAEAGGVTLPSSLPSGQAYAFTAEDGTEYGTITPAATITVSGSGANLCVEGVSGSGDTWSANLANGLRNYDCDGNANGVAPLVLSYADTSFTQGSNNETLAATASGGDGSSKSFSVSGTLPTGVTFDSATGTFTGPADSGWNFTVTQIDAGLTHTCAVLTDGTARCWGANWNGQLGDGSTTNSNTPVTVTGLSGITQIEAGEEHTCAVLTDGTARCWGWNGSGRLGDGSTTDSSTPVTVSGLSTVTQISAGREHTCALLEDGTARCWGRANTGQLGHGSHTADSSTPVTVLGLSGASQISGNRDHTCAVLTDGTARCWGSNSYGQLGDGTTNTYRTTPVTVSGLSTVTQISAGANHTCAVLTDGTARCWGSNYSGGLGDGSNTDSSTPVTVSGLSTVTQISAGPGNTCAVLTDGTARCWGANSSGQLGDGSNTDSNTPVTVLGLSGASQITLYGPHACALLEDGTARCWGWNFAGELGDGSTTDSSTPVDVSKSGPQPGFPATVDVTVTDDSGSTTESVTLSVG